MTNYITCNIALSDILYLRFTGCLPYRKKKNNKNKKIGERATLLQLILDNKGYINSFDVQIGNFTPESHP